MNGTDDSLSGWETVHKCFKLRACAVECRAAAGEGGGPSVRATHFGLPGIKVGFRWRKEDQNFWDVELTAHPNIKVGLILLEKLPLATQSKNGSTKVETAEGDVWCDGGATACPCPRHQLPGRDPGVLSEYYSKISGCMGVHLICQCFVHTEVLLHILHSYIAVWY